MGKLLIANENNGLVFVIMICISCKLKHREKLPGALTFAFSFRGIVVALPGFNNAIINLRIANDFWELPLRRNK